jgi:hypothetical protein|tara:strand:+ start:627 stop:1145 length:519 start_codon:yes stop_codon:yes gene_type:complete
MGKYIKLFEEYDSNTGSIHSNRPWSDLRNTMQNKLPFVIIDFKDRESYQNFKDVELQEKDYSDQTYTIRYEDNPVVMNSIFIHGNKNSDITSKDDRIFNESSSAEELALRYIKQYNIHRIISSERGKDFPTIYTAGGTSEFGNDLLVSLSPEELGNDDYYKIGSQLYKFIST